MAFLVHMLKYEGSSLDSQLELRNYRREDLGVYQHTYETCFAVMRKALRLTPVNYCNSEEHLLEHKDQVYILSKGDQFIGSIAIYGNEIDDLFVAKEFQAQHHGRSLLQFAVASMQKNGVDPILLHVADWNQTAMKLYLSMGFRIVETEMIK